MRRLAIIDHSSHELMVEDVSEDRLEGLYGGDEEAYIKDNYTFDGDFSWDWIVDAEYFPEGQSESIEIDFEDMADI